MAKNSTWRTLLLVTFAVAARAPLHRRKQKSWRADTPTFSPARAPHLSKLPPGQRGSPSARLPSLSTRFSVSSLNLPPVLLACTSSAVYCCYLYARLLRALSPGPITTGPRNCSTYRVDPCSLNRECVVSSRDRIVSTDRKFLLSRASRGELDL